MTERPIIFSDEMVRAIRSMCRFSAVCMTGRVRRRTYAQSRWITEKRDFCHCLCKAGFSVCGRTKGGLLALQLLPEDMPESAPALMITGTLFEWI